MTAGEYNDTKEHVFHIFFNLDLKPKTWQGRRYCKGRLVPLTPAIRSSPVFFLPPCEWSYSERMDKEFRQAEKHRRSRYTQGSYEPQSSQIPFPSK